MKNFNEKKQIINQLNLIKNKAFCCYTYDRARNEWKKIKDNFSNDIQSDMKELLTQIGNPDYSPNGYGGSYLYSYQKRCINLSKYIDKLILNMDA